MWLFYPKSNGAEVVYTKVLRPFLKKYEGKIDAEVELLENKLHKVEEEVASKLKNK